MVILTAFEKPRSLQKNINKCRRGNLILVFDGSFAAGITCNRALLKQRAVAGLVRLESPAHPQHVGRYFVDQHNLPVAVFQTAQLELAVDDMQLFGGKFPGNDAGDFLDQTDTCGDFLPGRRRGCL